MVGRLIEATKSAYQYPLIFKQLWHTPRVQTPDQEIVYRDLKRFTYLQIKERIGRLASALSKAGVAPGDTVGVLDWDSHRFLESVLRDPDDGRRVADGECPSVTRKAFADKGIISKYGIPQKVLFVDNIPRTSVGKVNKKELRERYGDV